MDTGKQFMVTGENTGLSDGYTTLHNEIKIELTNQVSGFVRIGYLLKLAKDTDILRESGYRDVMDFAKNEFSLTKDVVSRYIHICEKYSEGGNSPYLKGEYKDYGYSKLAEMLTLPDSIAEEIPPEATRREIQDIKRDYQQEQEITPLEVMAEPPMETAPEIQLNTLLGKVLYEIGRDDLAFFHDMYNVSKLYFECSDYQGEVSDTTKGTIEKQTLDALAPNGFASFRPRIPQIGRVMMTVQDKMITLTNMRTGEKETHAPFEVLREFYDTLPKNPTIYPEEEQYDRLYPKVAPVQQSEHETPKNDNNLQKSELNDKKPQISVRGENMTENTPKMQETAENVRNSGENVQNDPKAEMKTAENDAANCQDETGQKAAAPEPPKNDDCRKQNAASGDFINPPKDPEKVEIPQEDVEIVEKAPSETPKTRIDTLWDECLEAIGEREIAKRLIRADCLKFEDDADRKYHAEKLVAMTLAMIHHIREWKWDVVSGCAEEIKHTAAEIDRLTEERFDEKDK